MSASSKHDADSTTCTIFVHHRIRSDTEFSSFKTIRRWAPVVRHPSTVVSWGQGHPNLDSSSHPCRPAAKEPSPAASYFLKKRTVLGTRHGFDKGQRRRGGD